MELSDVMRTTGAVRQFTGDPLPDEMLQRILDDARFAPSGGNRQGVRVIAVRDAATRDRLAELSRPAAQRYAAQMANGESPWNPLRPCGVDEETIASTEPAAAMTASLQDASVVLVICVDLGVVAATDQALDRVGVVSGASVYPFVWNVLLAARNQGFGGVTTTMAISEEPLVKELLGIPDHYAIAALVPLGKPKHQVSKLKRKAVAEFVSRERFDGDSFQAP